MKGFALPRQFREKSLSESLSRNFRELTSFLNSFVVRFEPDGSSLLLPGDVTVDGVTQVQRLDYHTPTDGDGHLGFSSGNYLTHDAGAFTRFRSFSSPSYTNIGDINDDGLMFGGNGARVSRTTSDQSISAATTTVVDWNTEAFDSHGSIVDLANNTFDIPTGMGGLWLVMASVSWAAADPGTADLRVGVNGSDDVYLLRGGASIGTYAGVHGATLLSLSAGDTVDVRVRYTNASVVRSDANGTFSHASIVKIA